MEGSESRDERWRAARCIACGRDAGFNRAVLDVVTDEVVGGFCVRCERRDFGRSLARGDWGRVEGCALCDRDGFYALPLWLPYTEDRGGDTVCRVAMEGRESTPRLCDGHVATIEGSRERSRPEATRRANRV
ncbi:hypothetical protein [Halomarina pelagica]|uniref:hypothetical protein n=1 Tax=Halomarina pelagica TaxID=2961599 RepID=UPI0020C38E08|nr:hypothetical protein [Halomarina sp. BND7]